MQSEPHSCGHGMPLLGKAMSRAKIHRGCTDYFMRTVDADNQWKILDFFSGSTRILRTLVGLQQMFFQKLSADAESSTQDACVLHKTCMGRDRLSYSRKRFFSVIPSRADDEGSLLGR